MSSNTRKYIGMDVHKEAIAIAVLNSSGKLVMECVIETKAVTCWIFSTVCAESCTSLLKKGPGRPGCTICSSRTYEEIVVCNPRRNALLKEGSKSDRSMRGSWPNCCAPNMLRSVYHGEHGVRTLKELARSYLTITKDPGRVMSRVKAIYRSWGIPCAGKQVYAPRHRVGVAGQDRGSRRAPPGGVLLPAARCVEGIAPGSTARTAGRESETRRVENVPPDSLRSVRSGRPC